MSSNDQGPVPRIVVAVCTFRRNEPLRRLLDAVDHNAEQLGCRARVGVVVVDDNPDRRAEAVCREYPQRFALGLHYRPAGHGNISLARNLALEAALPLSDWVAMTDDDCEPVDHWLEAYLDAQERLGTDTLTGPCLLEPAPGAPAWITDQPFLEDAQFRYPDGERLGVAATNNSFIRSQFLVERPALRFDPELGVLGGEDMVFFRSAVAQGMSIAFASAAAVVGHEPPERCRFGYQLRSRYWLGNTEFVTNRHLGEASRPRWIARGLKDLAVAITRPARRLARGQAPQLRYATAAAARAVGMLVGALGIRIPHH